MKLRVRHIAAFATLLLLSPLALGKTALNAMCYLASQSTSHSVEGTNAQERYELASVSKIVTAFWALDVLGPDYRFKTRVDITPVDSATKTFDVHIWGGWDPYFGRESTHFLMSELSRVGARNIRNLTFDESFTIFWAVREKPTWSIEPSASDIVSVLRQKLSKTGGEYNSTRQRALKQQIPMEQSPRLKIGKILFLKKADYVVSPQVMTFYIQSAPLHSYLKEMNRNSNNHVADHIFRYLGGANEFQTYIKTRLDLDIENIRFLNGSGDKYLISDDSGKQQKIYNEASCEAIIQVLSATREVLQKYHYDLQHVMAVSGIDESSTLGGRYSGEQTSGAVVAKTGSVDPAITLAGIINTEQGPVYFGILYKTKGPGDWATARNKIRTDVTELFGRFGGKEAITDYSGSNFLPFDRESALRSIYDPIAPVTTLATGPMP